METSDEFSFAVETLTNICGGVLSRDVIITVLESCGGDLNLSVDAVMNITNDNDNLLPENVACDSDQVNFIKENEQRTVQSNENQYQPIIQNQTPSVSFAAASKKTGAMPKQQIKPKNSSPQADTRNWTEQFRRIVSFHNLGYRILVLMRGLPGSGKSFLAQRIVETTIGGKFVDFKTHICSTDDFFMYRGQYHFNREQLPDAHVWNQKRSKLAMEQGLSPLIIDNTNIEIWEMMDYVQWGVPNGYIIEVVEPNTPWAKKANQLSRRNIHNVPLITIQRKLDKYVDNITGDFLLKHSGMRYPDGRVPPVFRSMPVFQPDPQISDSISISNSTISIQSEEHFNTNAVSRLSISEPRNLQPTFSLSQEERSITSTTNIVASDEMLVIPFTTNAETISTIANDTSALEESVQAIVTNYDNSKDNENIRLTTEVLDTEVQKQIELEKVELEWESGENWVEEQIQQSSENSIGPDNIASTAPKPQRKNKLVESSDEKLLESVNNTQDWRQISMFMPPWQNKTASEISEAVGVPTETRSSSTCMEIGDAENSNNMFMVINASPKDINQFHMSFTIEKIPEKRMLDKSSMTNEHFFIDHSKRCKSEENHFKELKKLFKNVSKTALREIFDKCMGDVNWAVEIVLDGVASKQLGIVSEEAMSKEEEETDCSEDHQCNCLAAYNVLPDKSQISALLDEHTSINTKLVATISTPKAHNQKKIKKDANMSEDSLTLKRMIEQNVRVSDNHYSEHCLKIMRFRHGETELSEEVTDTGVNEETELAACTSSEPGYQETASCLPDDQNSDDGDSYIGMDDVEKTVVVNLGKEFVTELDALFKRKDMTYPDKVLPKISMPLSLLNEINALWMESLMHQLDEHDKQSAIMLQEDEEFARQLAMKEAELALEGKEPEVPDFKEIMDMDFAISIYQKDVAVWRSKEPNDLAAKLTRDKMYNLFPDVPKEILSELLMAHDNNFQNTVEVLLMSTGKADILEQKNGLNKFVMQKEMERQERILQEERRALTQVEWPLLPRGEVVEMSVVHEYRGKAEGHLVSRNLNLQKASNFIRRGMTQAASYFGDLANYHTIKYEQANSLAAASLMQVHASNCPDTATIDLHYLRVREARESLDLFLDTHIQRLKETAGRGPRHHTLFFITGRGLHSNGKPKIKPSVRQRLIERGLSCSERNPGLLTSRVCAEDMLTYQLP